MVALPGHRGANLFRSPMDPRQELVQSSASVRSDLERIRLDTQREIDRLNRELVERLEAADRCVDSVTDQLALEQEADRLRTVLHEREESLDAISAECRRLEDQLEDQNLAYDGLRQELHRKLEALRDARAQVGRLEAELRNLKDADHSGWIKPLTDECSNEPTGQNPAARRRPRFAIGLFAAILACIVGVAVWWRPQDPDNAQLASISPESASRAQHDKGSTVRPSTPGSLQVAQSNLQTADAPSRPIQALVLGRHRDRLRDGRTGPLMIELSSHRFVMGRDSPDTPDSGPSHTVDVGGFLIGAYEITFAEYDAFARANGHRVPEDFGWGRGRRPVVDVSWLEASAYAEWLSLQTGHRYRLPSEAEWELAARGGMDSSYWWGGYPERGRAACFDCGSQWDNRSTAPVASFPSNPFGLFDTAGNAAEWVADCYRPSYRGAPSDGTAWDAEQCEFRVVRGGAFSRPASSMRSFARSRLAPSTRLNMVGFRIARER